MARTRARLAEGLRLTDRVSLGVVSAAFPLVTVKAAVQASGTESKRQRLLPAHVVVYYVIALVSFPALFAPTIPGLRDWELG